MSDTLNKISGLSVTSDTVQLLYTVPTDTITTLINLIVMNQDDAITGTYQVWHVPSPGTAPADETDLLASKFILDQPIAAKERHSIDDREVMLAGAKLYIHCTTDVTVRGSILEQTT